MILVENILDKQTVSKLDSSVIQLLNEAMSSEISNNKKRLEADMTSKFEALVENISAKFSGQVNNVIVESVHNRIGKDVNDKLLGVVSNMVTILEDAGVYSTERTKELQKMLRSANEKLEIAFNERKELEIEYSDSRKENYILERLIGVKPEIVSKALDYFKDKDMIDVTDEIDAFVDGDFSNLMQDDKVKFDDGLTDVSLDQVGEVLQGINSDNEYKKAKNPGIMESVFDKLGQGLHKQKGVGYNRSPNISLNALTESYNPEAEEDTNVAMDQIDSFRDLGWKFR